MDTRHTMLIMLSALLLFSACEPSVKLTASWTDKPGYEVKFSKLLVMAIGRDLAKRRLGEEAICRQLRDHGYNAVPSLDEMGPDFADRTDSAGMQRALLDKGIDGVITVRVLSITEHDRWVPGGAFYGPVTYYRGFYSYYYRAWGSYSDPGYMMLEVQVLLESNLYEVLTGRLLWSGQSRAFSRDPTRAMAARYARNIVSDMIGRKALVR